MDSTLGQRAADRVAAAFGSWKFIWIQTLLVAAWMAGNIVGIIGRWDPYPFILLNLLFSTQAAYAAPLILLSQNRSAERDRERAEQDLVTDIETLGLVRSIAAHLGVDAPTRADPGGQRQGEGQRDGSTSSNLTANSGQ